MRLRFCITLSLVLTVNAAAWAVSKPHVIAFGKWTTATLLTGVDESASTDIKVRPLYVDGKLKEFTVGTAHEVTERLFVVRRMLRVNDALPSEAAVRWSWQRGGWMLVDRNNGHIAMVALPEFDADHSEVSWYRDYAAYCGISDDGAKTYALVMEVGRRKPLVKKLISDVSEGAACVAPTWQRQPARVTFTEKADQKITYTVHGRAVEIASDDNDEPTD
jgi:hypothetical protein